MFYLSLTRRVPTGQEFAWQVVERAASPQRFKEYLNASNNEGPRALELYTWNTEVSAAFWAQLGHVEIALRNNISASLRNYCQRVLKKENWICEAQNLKLFAYSELTRIQEAQVRVSKNNKDESLDQALSELSFGFWATLLSKRYRNLWPELARGFPGLVSRDSKELVTLVQQARWLRNRIGHHHRIWNLDLDTAHLQLLRISRIIDSDFGLWLSEVSKMPEMLLKRPETHR